MLAEKCQQTAPCKVACNNLDMPYHGNTHAHPHSQTLMRHTCPFCICTYIYTLTRHFCSIWFCTQSCSCSCAALGSAASCNCCTLAVFGLIHPSRHPPNHTVDDGKRCRRAHVSMQLILACQDCHHQNTAAASQVS